ncbi:hypothetical protein ACTHO0_25480 [Cytobacillus praedii]|uniref:hypothetical protein n=1 Tax=Cytobacillus praedii TaxID=1742358 RepID=UPI003F7EA1DD
MCGGFTLSATFTEIIKRFEIDTAIQEELYNPNYNVDSLQSVLSVINDSSKNRAFKPLSRAPI